MTGTKTAKKLLVPLDGSARSLKTVRYITRIEPFKTFRVVLFHVFSGIPEYYWDLEREPQKVKNFVSVRAWEKEQRSRIGAFMEKARRMLLHAGFSADAIEVKINRRKKGVARDILAEAHHQYWAVVTRRRGLTGMRGIVMGSVATKLLEKLTYMPMLIAGQLSPGKKLLLAFDGSTSAMHAVEFVAATLGGCDCDAHLFYAIRGDGQKNREGMPPLIDRENTEQAKKEMAPLFGRAVNRLVDGGFSPSRVSAEVLTGVYSRAAAIAGAAREGDFGTIVLGRRGLSRTRDFFIGRVTNKVVQLARNRTVWIIR
jgi:nucleotide-binding universal stress UspA family protein